MSNDKILDKIRKLLELSKSSNPHEAALAAKRAADMMAEHEIADAELRVTDGTEAEPTAHATAHKNRKRVGWQGSMANALARSMGCRMYWVGPNIQLFGRTSAVQTCAYTFQYLVRELEQQAKTLWKQEALHEVSGTSKGQRTKARNIWKEAFYTGAVIEINNRLRPVVERKPQASSQALVLVKRDREEVDRQYNEFIGKGRSVRLSMKARRADAMEHGRRVGRNVSLGAKGAGLPSPKKQVKS